MPEHEGLLFGIETRQHASQARGIGYARQHALNVFFVVEQGRDLRAELREHFLVNARRPLVNDEEGDVVFPHLSGDGAKNGLFCRGRVEKLVRFFDGDDQVPGLVFGLLRCVKLFALGDVLLVNAPRENIRHEQIREHTRLPSKFEHDVNAAVDVVHHRIHRVRAVEVIDHKGKIVDALELAMQGGQRAFVRADILGELLDIRAIHRQQLPQPAVFVHRIDEIGRFGGRGIELQLVLQCDHILHRDLIVGDVHLVIGLNPALPGRFRIQRKQGDLIAEQLLEALDKTASPLPAALFHRAKPVLVVHVKNEIDGLLVLDQAAQYQAREKGFARAGLAKNAIAALDKPVEIDAHRRVHVQRRAHVEKPVVLFLTAKYARHIFLVGLHDFGKMTRNGFDRARLIHDFLALFEHEHGPQRDRDVRARPIEHAVQQLVPVAGRVEQNVGIGGIEGQIRDHREELVFIPLDHHELAGFDVLNAAVGVEFHLDALGQRPARDNANFADSLNIRRPVEIVPEIVHVKMQWSVVKGEMGF